MRDSRRTFQSLGERLGVYSSVIRTPNDIMLATGICLSGRPIKAKAI